MRDLEEEVRRLRCKGEEDEGRHEDGSRIDPRGDVVTNGVEGVEEGVAVESTLFYLSANCRERIS